MQSNPGTEISIEAQIISDIMTVNRAAKSSTQQVDGRSERMTASSSEELVTTKRKAVGDARENSAV